jgi:hypothetical protein
MATESSNSYAPPRSAVKDVDGDEALELAYSLVDCLMIFSESRRTVHDRIADTIVIKA